MTEIRPIIISSLLDPAVPFAQSAVSLLQQVSGEYPPGLRTGADWRFVTYFPVVAGNTMVPAAVVFSNKRYAYRMDGMPGDDVTAFFGGFIGAESQYQAVPGEFSTTIKSNGMLWGWPPGDVGMAIGTLGNSLPPSETAYVTFLVRASRGDIQDYSWTMACFAATSGLPSFIYSGAMVGGRPMDNWLLTHLRVKMEFPKKAAMPFLVYKHQLAKEELPDGVTVYGVEELVVKHEQVDARDQVVAVGGVSELFLVCIGLSEWYRAILAGESKIVATSAEKASPLSLSSGILGAVGSDIINNLARLTGQPPADSVHALIMQGETMATLFGPTRPELERQYASFFKKQEAAVKGVMEGRVQKPQAAFNKDFRNMFVAMMQAYRVPGAEKLASMKADELVPMAALANKAAADQFRDRGNHQQPKKEQAEGPKKKKPKLGEGGKSQQMYELLKHKVEAANAPPPGTVMKASGHMVFPRIVVKPIGPDFRFNTLKGVGSAATVGEPNTALAADVFALEHAIVNAPPWLAEKLSKVTAFLDDVLKVFYFGRVSDWPGWQGEMMYYGNFSNAMFRVPNRMIEAITQVERNFPQDVNAIVPLIYRIVSRLNETDSQYMRIWTDKWGGDTPVETGDGVRHFGAMDGQPQGNLDFENAFQGFY